MKLSIIKIFSQIYIYLAIYLQLFILTMQKQIMRFFNLLFMNCRCTIKFNSLLWPLGGFWSRMHIHTPLFNLILIVISLLSELHFPASETWMKLSRIYTLKIKKRRYLLCNQSDKSLKDSPVVNRARISLNETMISLSFLK